MTKKKDTEAEREEAIEEILQKPVFITFTDETSRIRRNSLIFITIALIYKQAGGSIESIAPFGIMFDITTNRRFVDIVLFCLVLYHGLHFLWQSWDAVQEWRVRLTGHMTFPNSIVKGIDTENTVRQFSLMEWFNTERKKIASYHAALARLQAMEQTEFEERPLKERIEAIEKHIGGIRKIISDERITASLERFEKWYRIFGWSQLLRFILLEWGLPIGLSLWALYLLAPSFWNT